MGHEVVEITINKKTGVMKVECNGFVGEGCNVVEQIENEISNNIISRTDKDERYQFLDINPAQIGTMG